MTRNRWLPKTFIQTQVQALLEADPTTVIEKIPDAEEFGFKLLLPRGGSSNGRRKRLDVVVHADDENPDLIDFTFPTEPKFFLSQEAVNIWNKDDEISLIAIILEMKKELCAAGIIEEQKEETKAAAENPPLLNTNGGGSPFVPKNKMIILAEIIMAELVKVLGQSVTYVQPETFQYAEIKVKAYKEVTQFKTQEYLVTLLLFPDQHSSSPPKMAIHLPGNPDRLLKCVSLEDLKHCEDAASMVNSILTLDLPNLVKSANEARRPRATSKTVSYVHMLN